jgi:two-component system response regulator AtoC
MKTASPNGSAVLVADDDAVIRGNLALLLRSEGYRVVEAAAGCGRRKP